MKLNSPIALVAVSILVIAPVSAHHSHANYITEEFTHLTGTVTELAWTNPHVWLYMEIADDEGRSQLWTIEGGSPAALMRGGWRPDSLKPGDEVSVRCHLVRDGSAGCLMGFVTSINGTAMDKEFD